MVGLSPSFFRTWFTQETYELSCPKWDLHMEFTRLVFQYYYNMDKLPEKEQQEIMLRIRRSAVVEFSRWMYILPEEKPDILPMVQQQLEELRIK